MCICETHFCFYMAEAAAPPPQAPITNPNAVPGLRVLVDRTPDGGVSARCFFSSKSLFTIVARNKAEVVAILGSIAGLVEVAQIQNNMFAPLGVKRTMAYEDVDLDS
jgi:hypothetical protein